MSKVTSFTMPNSIRAKLNAIIDHLKALTGDNVSMAAAICTAIEYYYIMVIVGKDVKDGN